MAILQSNKVIKVAYDRGEEKYLIRTAVINAWHIEWDLDIKKRNCFEIQKPNTTRWLTGMHGTQREEVPHGYRLGMQLSN